eukprot:scaffold85402_cov36-Phaeocystis_antarctica.AAC.1
MIGGRHFWNVETRIIRNIIVPQTQTYHHIPLHTALVVVRSACPCATLCPCRHINTRTWQEWVPFTKQARPSAPAARVGGRRAPPRRARWSSRAASSGPSRGRPPRRRSPRPRASRALMAGEAAAAPPARAQAAAWRLR